MPPKPCILLVEDDDGDALLTTRALKQGNLALPVVRAEDGQQALDYVFARGAHAARDPADLPRVILLDLKLPRVNGLEVLKALRADARTKRLPVIIMTSSAEERDRLAAFANNVSSYVTKPVNYDQFVEAAHQLSLYWLVVKTPRPANPVPGPRAVADDNRL